MTALKRCPACGETKPTTEFGRNQSLGDGLSFYCLPCNRKRNRRFYRERRQAQGHTVRDHSWIPDGFRWCPSCEQPVAHEAYTRNSRTASGFGSQCKACHRTASSASYFYRKYKLTRKQVADLRGDQGNCCAICGAPDPQHLDHDHATGTVRQLLCQRCNQGLGLLQDDPVVLRAAAGYVERHRARQAVASSRPSSGERPGSPPLGRRPGIPRDRRCSPGFARWQAMRASS